METSAVIFSRTEHHRLVLPNQCRASYFFWASSRICASLKRWYSSSLSPVPKTLTKKGKKREGEKNLNFFFHFFTFSGITSSSNHVSLAMVALGRPWAYSKRGCSGLITGKTDDGRRTCSDSVYCAEEGDRKGSLIYSVCCIHDEPLGFGRIPTEVGSSKSVEYRTFSGRVVHYGRTLYLVVKNVNGETFEPVGVMR